MAASKLSDNERALYESVKKGDVEEVRRQLSLSSVNVDCLDEHGMTPLMQAAYKGDIDMCELLLAHGADVNSNFHEHQYTCLMFACLSGSTECTRLLLEAGARVTVENNVGRTAGQLGAFVGRHECVSLINNFISVEDIEYYSVPRGLEKEAKLPKHLVQSVHRLCIITNLNPVKIVLHLRGNKELLDNYQKVYKVLQLKAEKFVKAKDMNELMAMKLHYISCVVKKCGRWRDELEGKGGEEGFLKYLVKGRPSDGFPLGTEDVIRQIIKEFEFHDCVIFKQLVSSIGPVEKGNDPTALTVLTQAINGMHSADFSNCCVVCGESKAVKKCAACKMVTYCAVTCQKLHWPTHKKHCKSLAQKHEEALKAAELAAEKQERDNVKQNGVHENLEEAREDSKSVEIEGNSKKHFHLRTEQNGDNGEQSKDEKPNHQRGSNGHENGKITGVECSVQNIVTTNNGEVTSCDSHKNPPT